MGRDVMRWQARWGEDRHLGMGWRGIEAVRRSTGGCGGGGQGGWGGNEGRRWRKRGTRRS